MFYIKQRLSGGARSYSVHNMMHNQLFYTHIMHNQIEI